MRYTPTIFLLAAMTAVVAAPAPAPNVGAPGPVISYFALHRSKDAGTRRTKRDGASDAGDDPDDLAEFDLDSRAVLADCDKPAVAIARELGKEDEREATLAAANANEEANPSKDTSEAQFVEQPRSESGPDMDCYNELMEEFFTED